MRFFVNHCLEMSEALTRDELNTNCELLKKSPKFVFSLWTYDSWKFA